MSLQSILFRISAGISDFKRDRGIDLPAGISQCRNMVYATYGHHHYKLDVYFPDGTKGSLPTIVNIHGGGYVYGSKELYRRYGMDLARRGFSVVNFNYRLAPHARFPAPLEDTNAVMEWVCANAEEYHLDPNNLFLVGDSAGAQLASQYAAIYANPGYAKHFSFRVPAIRILALGLNCGLYDLTAYKGQSPTGLIGDYLGPHPDWDDPRLQVLEAIDERYPAVYLATGSHDFLKPNLRPMYDYLLSRNVKCAGKCYGTDEDDYVCHVFHVDISLQEAGQCNDDECAYFRFFLEKEAPPIHERT